MKKILFPTDFSANAKHALTYAYRLATQVKAELLICNAVIEPAEIPQAGLVAWPIEESEVLFEDDSIHLDLLKRYLEKGREAGAFYPAISCIEEPGTVIQVVDEIVNKHNVGLIVMGTHSRDGLTTLILGNHSRDMINNTTLPLLLVPPDAKIAAVKKIAFATDFADLADDLNCINKLITLARPLNAEILVVNIFKKDEHEAESYIKELSARVSYPLLYYRLVKAGTPEDGLDYLCKRGQVDMLAMVHRNKTFVENLLGRSHTQKMAKHIAIPLLVFPANTGPLAPML